MLAGLGDSDSARAHARELLEAADIIVFLDLPWRVAYWRIITRHLRASLAGTGSEKKIQT